MPVTSRAYPVSDSQRRLLRSLVTERRTGFTTETIETTFPSMTSREASRLISQMMDAPRSRSAERRFFTESDEAPRYEESSEELPIVQTATREGRMLSAGRLHMTVTLPSGEHVALRARNLQRNRERVSGWEAVPYGTEGSRIRVSTSQHRTVGWVTGGSISWTPRITRDVQNAVRAMFGIAGHESNRANWEACGYGFAVEDRCGRCARPLTDPESIARGIGPECFGRMTASVHAQVIEDASERFEAARDSFDSHSLIHGTFPTSFTDEQVPSAPVPVLTEDVKEARETIAEALDAYCSDTERDTVMRVFDELVAKTAAQLVLDS